MDSTESRFLRFVGTVIGVFILVLSFTVTGHSGEKIRFQNYWVVTPQVGPLLTVLEKGYYKEAGLDVDFPVGKGSAHAIQMVAAGKMDFGISDFGAAALAISREVPIKGIFCYLQKSPLGIISRKEAGIKGPKDLEGKRLGFSPADSGWLLFPVFANANGVNTKRITLVSSEPASRDKLLLTEEVDAIVAYPATGVVQLRDKGADVTSIRYADFKVNALGAGLMAHEKTLKERPEIVRRFIQASAKGFKRALENPEETVDVLVKRAPLTITNKKTALEIVKGSLDDLHTERSKGKPIGWMAKGDWQDTITILSKVGKLKKVMPVDRYYTNEFATGKK
jgi:NitT/TauT family transport system substrate-binding protein